MNNLQVQYFLCVAQNQSITAAAEKLFVSSPAISRQIRSLEYELGTPLFMRTGRGMRLLPEGELLRDALLKSEQLVQDTCEEIKTRGIMQPDTLRFGIVSSWDMGNVLCDLREHLKSKNKDSMLSVTSGNTHHLIRMLEDNQLDIIMIPTGPVGMVDSQTLEQHYLCSISRVIYYSSRSTLAGNRYSDGDNLSEFANEPLVIMMDIRDSNILEYCVQLCKNLGFIPSEVIQKDNDSVFSEVESGRGFTFADIWSRAFSHRDYEHIILKDQVHISLFHSTGYQKAIVDTAVVFLKNRIRQEIR